MFKKLSRLSLPICLSLFITSSPMLAMEQRESEPQELTAIFNEDIWNEIARFLPGDNGWLNDVLARQVELDDEIYGQIADAFIKKIGLFEDHNQHPFSRFYTYNQADRVTPTDIFFPTKKDIPALAQNHFSYCSRKMSKAMIANLAQYKESFHLLANGIQTWHTYQRDALTHPAIGLTEYFEIISKPQFLSAFFTQGLPLIKQLSELNKDEKRILKLLTKKSIEECSQILSIELFPSASEKLIIASLVIACLSYATMPIPVNMSAFITKAAFTLFLATAMHYLIKNEPLKEKELFKKISVLKKYFEKLQPIIPE